MSRTRINRGTGRRPGRSRCEAAGVCLGGVALGLILVVATCALICGGCSSAIDQARSLESQGDWAGALNAYEAMLVNNPDDLSALSGAAVALLMMQRHDEALVYQERVVELDAEDAQTRVELGFNYLNHQNRPKDAVRVLSEAATIDRSAKHLTFMAQAQREAGDDSGAEESLRESIGIDPDYVYAYRVLVGLLKSQGRDSEVESLRAQAQSLGLDISQLD